MKKQYIIPQINIVALEYSTHIMEASAGEKPGCSLQSGFFLTA